MTIKRGELYWVNWNPGRGSEQQGRRPALVLQNDLGNATAPTTIVAAVSTKFDRVYPFQVHLTPAESGLREASIVKCEQVMTVDKTRLESKIGQLLPEKMLEVEIAVCRSLGIRRG